MSRSRSLVLFIALTVTTALIASGAAGAATSAKRLTRSAAASPSPQLALQRALALFAPARVDKRFRAAVADVSPRDATLVLRDLVAQRSKLSKADRRLAGRILARPTDGPGVEGPAGYNSAARASKKRFCNTRFCIHWVRVSNERPSLADNNPNNNRPDYVDKTIANMATVWNKEIGAYGYKKPLSDTRSGPHHGGNPNGRIDIFIANIGDQGLYGYCTTDDPRVNPNTHRQNSAYCVIDNDFRPAEFPPPSASGNNANKVTLAHEFFHAVQFAYDTFDVAAVMEGTATWMEDEVFNSVNDNRQYLSQSPLGSNPWQALDAFDPPGQPLWQYGTWIFYRFLSEKLGAGANDFPVVVKRIWQQAVGPARQGFGAIVPALVQSGTTLSDEMVIFGEWNSAPDGPFHYREGGAYPTATPNTTPGVGGTLGPAGFDAVNIEMIKRSNDYVRYDPSAAVGAGATLDFSGVMKPAGASRDLTAYAFAANDTIVEVQPVANGASIAFASATVDRVVVVLTNSSSSNYFGAANDWEFDVAVNP